MPQQLRAPEIERQPVELKAVPFSLEYLVERFRPVLPLDDFAVVQDLTNQAKQRVVPALLEAFTLEALSHEFEQSVDEFAEAWVGIAIRVWKALGEKTPLFLWETDVSMKRTLEERGQNKLDDEVLNWIFLGVTAIGVVNRATAQHLYRALNGQVESLPREPISEMIDSVLAYGTAMLAVTSFINNGDYKDEAATRNVRILSEWSYQYGMKAYHKAKEAGLVKMPRIEGEVPPDADHETQPVRDAAFRDYLARAKQEGKDE